ncbi:MAG: DNA mismatch repair protein MutS [Candidatus Micrarchaeota archaeon]|nr:DNA mismatch repair protein MutS [Candidatus Micrarchaeota archaeon]
MVGEGVGGRITPAMAQYWEIKKKYQDCLVLFRMGDFYEAFYDDAKVVSRDLQIVLTSRGKNDAKAPLAGIPYHALESYLKKLIGKGHKVVVVEQLEDPRKAKGLVKRGVVRVITPGTLIEPALMSEKSNNYIISIFPAGSKMGLCACDVSTGEALATELAADGIDTEFEKYKPAEVIVPQGHVQGYEWLGRLEREYGFKKTELEAYRFDEKNGEYILSKINGTGSFAPYGLEEFQYAKKAVSGILSYMEYASAGATAPKLHKISYYSSSRNMIIDATTMRNLDLLANQADGTERGTLLSVLDKTVTPMGGRTLKRWVSAPLLDKAKIEERLGNVEELMRNPLHLEKIRGILSAIGDIERIATRIAYRNVLPRELLMLRQSIEKADELKQMVAEYKLRGKFFDELIASEQLDDVARQISLAIDENAKQLVRDGGVIKSGYSEELDRLRGMIGSSQEWIGKLEEEERQRTGIKTLKVRYNKIIGYYIEVPKSQADKVPQEYVRKQTQLASERFISPRLKEAEVMVLNAEERIKELEQEIYDKIVEYLGGYTEKMYTLSSHIAELDVYQSFAKVSYENRYVKPAITENEILDIKGGRHPVVEKATVSFVPNDVKLDKNNMIMVITGPNMAGKSTVMRQVALITIMAHMGCFVPAESAVVPLTDRVFTRVGARDDITRGQSTFMTEMVECANILNNATSRSLVILDEVGRGTSTYDGMAIAWAILEYIAEKIQCKTMFATHYHLLNLLSVKYPYINNYNVAVEEGGNEVVFLHKLVQGGTDKSYGVHVARLAGLPREVVDKAAMLSKSLEQNDFVHKETLHRLAHGKKSHSLKEDRQTSIGSW